MDSSMGVSETLQVPCLGRPMELGMLYDCRKEQVITAVTLWDRSIIDQYADTVERRTSDFEVITDETLEKKAAAFGISGEMKLSFLSGLVDVGGSAKYLSHTKTKQHDARVTLKYSSTSFFQQLCMEQLAEKKIQHMDIFDKDIATHVITGIQYGADAVFVFERDIEENENSRKVNGTLKAVVEKIPFMKLKGGDLTSDNNESSVHTNSRCTFHGDICLENIPTTLDEAIAVYKCLPKLISATVKKGNLYGVPKTAYLHPLCKLNDRASSLARQISSNRIAEVENLLETYSLLQLTASDLEVQDVYDKIPGIRKQLSCFKTLVSRHVSNFQQVLVVNLPKIRGGEEEEKILGDYIIKEKKSPFNCDNLERWIVSKKTEQRRLEGYFENLKDFPFAHESGEIEKLSVDVHTKYVISFNFGSITNKSHPFLTLLANALEDNVSCNETDYEEDDEWYNDTCITNNLQKSTKLFRRFANANCSKESLKFVINTSISPRESRETPGNILVYKRGEKTRFQLPSHPGIPTALASLEQRKVSLQWKDVKNNPESVFRYSIRGKFDDGSGEIFDFKTYDNHLQIILAKLVPNTAYKFQVSAECEFGLSEFSDWSDPITTLPRPSLAKQIHRTCIKIKSVDGLDWYQLPLKETFSDTSYQLKKVNIFKSHPDHPRSKVILLVGATGSGKTTLINGLVNYMLGVCMEDNWRFQLINESTTNKSQTESQTSEITAYTIYCRPESCVPFTVTIIDTPGFGDTRGIDQDKQIMEQIRKFFKMKGNEAIDQLDAVGFVAPASDARLTEIQKYVFDSILSLFGNDIANNIFMMLTFADGSEPPILEAANKHGLKYRSYHKFNNSVFTLTSKNPGSEFNTLYWKIASHGFKKFFDELYSVQPTSLKLTRQVLNHRKQLEDTIECVQKRISSGIITLENMRQHLLVIEQYAAEKNASSEYSKTVEVIKQRKIKESEKDPNITYCLQCHTTCHENCLYFYDEDKYMCSSMDRRGEESCCCVCTLKCHWKRHTNVNSKFEEYVVVEEVTIEQLKQKYEMANMNMSKTQNMITGFLSTYTDVQLDVVRDMNKARESLTNLNKIAMKPNPLTTIDYINLLIKNAEQDNKPGKLMRIAQLRAAKTNAELIKELAKGPFDPFIKAKEQIMKQIMSACAKYMEIVFKPVTDILCMNDPDNFDFGWYFHI